MDDTNPPVDANSLVNVILPLDLFGTALFPSEEIFDLLYQHLRAHFASSATSTTCTSNIPQLTQKFLFSICTILQYDATSKLSSTRYLPSVLNRLNSWRLLSTTEKLLDKTVQDLALGLAGIVDRRVSVDNQKCHRRLRIRWIGADSELYMCYQDQDQDQDQDLPPSESKSTLQTFTEGRKGGKNPTPSSLSHLCPDTSAHDTARFRNGCCCCRQPRNSIVCTGKASVISPQDVQTNVHPIKNALRAIHNVSQHQISRSGIPPSIFNSKILDENISPSLIQSSNRRSLSSRISAPASSKIPGTHKKKTLLEPAVPHSIPFSTHSNDQNTPLLVSQSQAQFLSAIDLSLPHANASASCFQVNAPTLYPARLSYSSSTSHRKPTPKSSLSTSRILASSTIINSYHQSCPSTKPKLSRINAVKQKDISELETTGR